VNRAGQTLAISNSESECGSATRFFSPFRRAVVPMIGRLTGHRAFLDAC